MNSTTMSKTYAAYLILREAEKPLHVKEITKIALDRKLIVVKGLTPADTLASDLLQETRRMSKQNRPARFKKVGPSVWTLAR